MSQVGWLTPDFPPEHRFYTRKLLIPATSEFLALVNGALIELCRATNWEKDGEMEPEEAADFFMAMFQQYLVFENEPPDWETPDELDGLPAQPWYDDLADWIIAGFLAITFTPQAAITYTATVPKLRIAFRTGNIGALFKVLINGVEVWTGDSYAPITDLIDQVFDMSAETEPYTVRIEHNGIGENVIGGEAKLEVIRGEAVASMVATILRADPTGCGVQWSTDNGGTWETVDLATCITGLANSAITQAIEDGTITSGSNQAGPQDRPAPGTCQTFHVLLPAHDIWNSPCVINTGDTIQVTNWRGQWNDGYLNGLLAWECGDGGVVFLGNCTDPDVADPSDPLQTAAHMAIIGRNSVEYFSPLTIYTVPAGIVGEHFILQANDDPLTDNSGLVSFDVEICAGSAAENFCNLIDFTASDGDFYAVLDNGNARAVWSSSGWGFGYQGYNHIEHNFSNEFRDFEITSVEVWRDFQCDAGRDRLWAYNNDNQMTTLLYDGNYAGWSREFTEGLYKTTWTDLSYIGILKLDVFGDVSTAIGHVVRVVLRGPGQGPRESNCT